MRIAQRSWVPLTLDDEIGYPATMNKSTCITIVYASSIMAGAIIFASLHWRDSERFELQYSNKGHMFKIDSRTGSTVFATMSEHNVSLWRPVRDLQTASKQPSKR